MTRKTKKFSKRGAITGFIISLILLTLIYVTYYTTTSKTLLSENLSPVSQLLVLLYSWLYMLIVFLFSKIGLQINNIFLFFILSSGSYAIIGGFIKPKKKRKKKK